MNEKSDARSASGDKNSICHDKLPTSISGSVNAPFVYFEEAQTFGQTNGVIQITLEAVRLYPNPPGVTAERVAVAHLRMNAQAAIGLREAINGALGLPAPAHDAKGFYKTAN